MNFLKKIKISMTPLNIILSAVIIVSLCYTIFYMVQMVSGVELPSIPDSYVEDQVKKSFEIGKYRTKYEYSKMEKNLFHPERKVVKRIPLETSIQAPQITLYGTFISPELKMAYLDDLNSPYSNNSGVPRQRAFKKGDIISGFVLKEIYPERIVLVRNDEKITIHLKRNEKTVRDHVEKQPYLNPSPPTVMKPTGQELPGTKDMPSVQDEHRNP
jgi:hypothetical protein